MYADQFYLRGLVFWDEYDNKIGELGKIKTKTKKTIYIRSNEKLLGFKAKT